MFFHHEWRHHLQAYVTEPPLCSHGPADDGAGSTLEYDHTGWVTDVVGRLLRRARSLMAAVGDQEALAGTRGGRGGARKNIRKADVG